MNWVGSGKKQPLPNLGKYLGIYLKGLKNQKKGLSQCSQCYSRDSNQAPTEHVRCVTARVNLFGTFANIITLITPTETLTDQVTDWRLQSPGMWEHGTCHYPGCRQQIPSKHHYLSTTLHCTISQETVIFKVTRIQTSNVTIDQSVDDLSNYKCQDIK
jgi:hypothetical protein